MAPAAFSIHVCSGLPEELGVWTMLIAGSSM
jgi:hypothetical protein